LLGFLWVAKRTTKKTHKNKQTKGPEEGKKHTKIDEEDEIYLFLARTEKGEEVEQKKLALLAVMCCCFMDQKRKKRSHQ